MHTPESEGAADPLVLSVTVAPDFAHRLADTVADQVRRRLEPHLRPWSDAPLLDPKGLARKLAVSVRTVDDLVSKGEIIPRYVGKQRRFTPEAIDAYLRTSDRRGGGAHR